MGSSPRVRGSRKTVHDRTGLSGIIPAGAGLTLQGLLRSCETWDHPRGCGAHSINTWTPIIFAGSSPRVRGSHLMLAADDDGFGIIPAGAGLTACRADCSRCYRDHPRGCGAHPAEFEELTPGEGSSPRVRGSHNLRHCP